MRACDLLLEGAAQVVTLDDGRPGPKRGRAAMNDVGLVEDGAVAIARGKVLAVGATDDLRRRFRARRRVDLEERVLLPGLVDAHTHPVFARMREEEFALRCRGASYEQVLAAGGGILASAEALQGVPVTALACGVRRHLDRMLLHGTTTVEAKSGYGLTTASELASLEALRLAAREHPMTVVPTFLGAHALPAAYRTRRRAYVDEVVGTMLPAVARRRLARYCDVFVERGAFTRAEGLRILRAARRLGLGAKVHADEFGDSGGATLAAAVGAASAEHLGGTGRAGIRALARAGVVPVLLPATSLFLGLAQRPQARAMVEAGCPVALASDFNPGSSPTENLALVAALGCTTLGLTPEEALVGITRNAAAAIGEGHRAGRIAPGRPADLVVLDAPTWLHLPYRLGTNLVRSVYVAGRRVVHDGRRVA
ncbi:MAG: imidazolonepropionase [Planctomycetia bacterium]